MSEVCETEETAGDVDLFDFLVDCANLIASEVVAEAEVTIIVRLPGNEECEILVSNDDSDELINLLERCRSRPTRFVSSKEPTQ